MPVQFRNFPDENFSGVRVFPLGISLEQFEKELFKKLCEFEKNKIGETFPKKLKNLKIVNEDNLCKDLNLQIEKLKTVKLNRIKSGGRFKWEHEEVVVQYDCKFP